MHMYMPKKEACTLWLGTSSRLQFPSTFTPSIPRTQESGIRNQNTSPGVSSETV
ncbi:Protein of unknown function [Pyronema omphalodes CBS 100304]|uniref:Uncharacterized protein n=1 Tax=Pyronema omphalodes (strain CBS 100304) TaxID=1076935 RepID=U4LV92_PYROM|nr:Protein of unknown function [Pyronema omphalodes CBS 100304]